MLGAMMGDRKKLMNDITIMIGKKGPVRDKEGNYNEYSNSNSEQEDDSSEMKMFAQDIIKAVQGGNAARLAQVLSAFKSCCQNGEEEGEMEEGMESKDSKY